VSTCSAPGSRWPCCRDDGVAAPPRLARGVVPVLVTASSRPRQLRGDDDGVAARCRPRVGAGVHDAVLDAADRLAVLHERVRGADGSPSRSRSGSSSSSRRGTGRAVSRRSCGGAVGLRLGRGTVATKYYQRKHRLDCSTSCVADGDRRDPLTLLPWYFAFETTEWGMSFVARSASPARSPPASASCSVTRTAPPACRHGLAQHVPIRDRAALVDGDFGERLTRRMAGIACLARPRDTVGAVDRRVRRGSASRPGHARRWTRLTRERPRRGPRSMSGSAARATRRAG